MSEASPISKLVEDKTAVLKPASVTAEKSNEAMAVTTEDPAEPTSEPTKPATTKPAATTKEPAATTTAKPASSTAAASTSAASTKAPVVSTTKVVEDAETTTLLTSSSVLSTSGTTTSTPKSTLSSKASSDSGSNVGMIAGIAGGVVGVILIGAIIFCLMRRNKRKSRTNRDSRRMDDMFTPGNEKAGNYDPFPAAAPAANTNWDGYPSEQGFTVASPQATMVDYHNQVSTPPVAYAAGGQYYNSTPQYPDETPYSPQLKNNAYYPAGDVVHDTNINSLNHQQQNDMYYEPQLQQQQMYHDPQDAMYHDPHQQMYQDQSQQGMYQDQSQQMYQDPTLAGQQQAMYNQQVVYQTPNTAYADPNDVAYNDPTGHGYQGYQDNNGYYYNDTSYMNGQPASQYPQHDPTLEYNKPQTPATSNYATSAQPPQSYQH
ncbi:hypothetical protein BDB01DRAFT_893094 [Pilobolus umbonatus]|nr:hypothetical protein BDB01DRAFT_893094 [Pilobolus umbonatus]